MRFFHIFTANNNADSVNARTIHTVNFGTVLVGNGFKVGCCVREFVGDIVSDDEGLRASVDVKLGVGNVIEIFDGETSR